ncbi:hypothetical protein IFM89_033737 [Coptis chinensis]|uniref:Uncharacterized protein n=1 Tax=Coptis chinensis TaxID=261450 RepID=A0A835LFV4_9MAGN|nr:hypothetical protein IFM89_033737 [Coptis chinensis]
MNTFSCLETLSVCISESCMGAVWLYFCISEIYVSDVVERDTSRKTAPKKKDGVKVSQSEKTVTGGETGSAPAIEGARINSG